jgi:hypothetical protein
VAEEWQRLFDKLSDEALRAIALWQLEGWTVDEIAAQAGLSPRTMTCKAIPDPRIGARRGQP